MRLAQCKSSEGQGCRREVTLRRDTFEGSHLQLELIIRLIHLWSTKTHVGKAVRELKVGIILDIIIIVCHLLIITIQIDEGTGIDFMRDVCAQY